MTWQMNPRYAMDDFMVVAIGICLWLTQLVWIHVSTDRGSEPTQPSSLHHQSLDFVSHHLCSFLTCSMLLYVRCFTYTPCTIICGEVVLHTLCYVFYEFVWQLHALCYFMCGVCLIHPVLFMWNFFWHTPFCFVWGVCLRHPVLFYVGSFYFMWGVSISTIQPILFDIQSFCYIYCTVLHGLCACHIMSCFI